jgi:hypothetical protein
MGSSFLGSNPDISQKCKMDDISKEAAKHYIQKKIRKKCQRLKKKDCWLFLLISTNVCNALQYVLGRGI